MRETKKRVKYTVLKAFAAADGRFPGNFLEASEEELTKYFLSIGWTVEEINRINQKQ